MAPARARNAHKERENEKNDRIANAGAAGTDRAGPPLTRDAGSGRAPGPGCRGACPASNGAAGRRPQRRRAIGPRSSRAEAQGRRPCSLPPPPPPPSLTLSTWPSTSSDSASQRVAVFVEAPLRQRGRARGSSPSRAVVTCAALTDRLVSFGVCGVVGGSGGRSVRRTPQATTHGGWPAGATRRQLAPPPAMCRQEDSVVRKYSAGAALGGESPGARQRTGCQTHILRPAPSRLALGLPGSL